ncbi:hypothetical protein LSH36_81g00004 [Paralvinella palmiformis]|uniref:Uncharacterized protein n=1 Tax=Paralvinella palmiformis TaxID=53620 RepID=A0AAD9K3E8_9ANNE|nr:hypothetical protein LSH36_81g00004 [Paralvinella palmiformis]
MTSLLRQIIIVAVIITIGNARPGGRPWKIDPHHVRDVKHNVPEFHNDNGAFFYPEQEFFDEDTFKIEKHHNKHKHDFKDDEDFSGWHEIDDDEDALRINRIPTISRDPADAPHARDIEFGPDDVIHEISPYGHYKHRPYIVLEEEHFGNELNDIDKVQELTRRMEQMQREMQQIKTLLENEYSLLKGRK